jgi:uncharacterized CHY-type Zn-finger protein
VKVEYEVCDRCGKEINYHSKLLARVNKVKIKWIICGEVMETERRFCKDCTEELDRWLYPKKADRG